MIGIVVYENQKKDTELAIFVVLFTEKKVILLQL